MPLGLRWKHAQVWICSICARFESRDLFGLFGVFCLGDQQEPPTACRWLHGYRRVSGVSILVDLMCSELDPDFFASSTRFHRRSECVYTTHIH